MTKILNYVLFLLKTVVSVLTWPIKTIYGLFSIDPNQIIIDPLKSESLIPDDPNWLPPNAKIFEDPHKKIHDWYISRKKGEYSEDNIYDLLADILPEGELNPKDWQDEVTPRSGGINSSPYTVIKNPLSYSKRNPFEFTILEVSTGPNVRGESKKVKNPSAKYFKALPYEKVLSEDPLEKLEKDNSM